MCCQCMEMSVSVDRKIPYGRAAQTMRLAKYRIEYRRQITWRCVDDAEHLCRRRLLFQCLPLLCQQSGVLHRDYCLGREILQQRNLLAGERANLQSERCDEAQQNAILAQ